MLLLVATAVALAGVAVFKWPLPVGLGLVVASYAVGVWSDPEHKLWRPLGFIDTWRNVRDPEGAHQRLVDTLESDWGAAVTQFLMTLPMTERAHAEWVLRKAKGRDRVERTYLIGDRERRVAIERELLGLAGFDAEIESVAMKDGSVAFKGVYRRRKAVR